MRDASNNLVGEYFYDGEGKRVKKNSYIGGVLDETTVFVYSNGKLAAEYSTKPPPQNPTTNWTVTDMLGSPRVILNSLGEVVSRRDFLPFGEEILPDQNVNFRTAGQKYVGDGVRDKEEYLKPLFKGRKGSSYVDITATHPKYGTIRINTVDTLKNGKTPTARERRNAARIRKQRPGEHLLLVPKRR